MEHEVARILDANFNRAREGLRVAEEFARFVVEDRRLAAQGRAFRHELADLARRLGGDLLDARDTAGDVGTAPPSEPDAARTSTADVATAAAKRVGEALRVLCEYSKLADPDSAARLDQLRYRFYDWEKWLAGAGERRRFARVRLYLLLTAEFCPGGDWQGAAKAAIDGGVDAIQLREKTLADGELLGRAGWLVETCRAAGVLSFVNDRPDVARLAGADGVHVGQGDLPVAAVRRIVKPSQIVGVSTHTPGQLESAVAAGPDYVALGPMFATATKPDYAVAGVEYAKAAVERLADAGVPHVAVGGITADNAGQLAAVGVRCVAVSSWLLGAKDISSAAARLKAALGGAG